VTEIPLKLKYRTRNINTGGFYKPRSGTKSERNKAWAARQGNRAIMLVIAETHYRYPEQRRGYRHPILRAMFGG